MVVKTTQGSMISENHLKENGMHSKNYSTLLHLVKTRVFAIIAKYLENIIMLKISL